VTDINGVSRTPCLDGIRATAALMIMIFHFAGRHGEPRLLVQASYLGQTGVDLFFVLSGFLITGILLRSKNDPQYFRTFYARRILRIFPLYFLYLSVYFFVLPSLFSKPVPSFESQLWSWCFLQNVPETFTHIQSSGPEHLWSLAVEEHFYLIWPLLVFSLPRRSFIVLVLATLATAPILRNVFESNGINTYYFTLTRMDSLGYGALLAVFLSGGELRYARSTLLLRILLIAIPVVLFAGFALFTHDRAQRTQEIMLSLMPAFYFALIGFCLIDPFSRPLVGVFSVRWLRWLGSISYGLYLIHPTCFAIIERFVRPAGFFVDIGLSFGLTIFLAYMSFRFFESPFLRLRRWFVHGKCKTNDGIEQAPI
jgi:peptidoglycan/LPS O-acetylase OafA/YrhL